MINQDKLFLKQVIQKLIYHKNRCEKFKNFIQNQKINLSKIAKLEYLPFLHVNIFKEYELYSCKKENIIMQLNSSGTTGSPSKIFLDKKNTLNQKKILKHILINEFGNERLPYLIIDKNPLRTLERKKFNAKLAAIFGFGIIGYDNTYILNDSGEIDYSELNKFLKKYSERKFLIFGFTSQIYEILCERLSIQKLKFPIYNGIILHGGGWKKLEHLKIDNKKLKKILKSNFKIDKVINYYGFVEQTGSIFLECPEEGYFHTNNFTDIFVRDSDFKLCSLGEKGVLQSISTVPSSYPGNSILLEDQAIYFGKNCKCGRKGKTFKIIGRLKKAEVRGCSDVQ